MGLGRVVAAMMPLVAAGCVSTAVGVVKAPFRAAGKAVDWTTTSQDEADRNHGRRMRKAEAKEGKQRRDLERRCRRDPQSADCQSGYRGYSASGAERE